MTREYEIVNSERDTCIKEFRHNLVVDDLNKVFYFKDYSAKHEVMNMLPIGNEISSKADRI
jgi:hypothetical protein